MYLRLIETPLGAGIGSAILLGHTFLGDFMPFLISLLSDEAREQFAGSKHRGKSD